MLSGRAVLLSLPVPPLLFVSRLSFVGKLCLVVSKEEKPKLMKCKLLQALNASCLVQDTRLIRSEELKTDILAPAGCLIVSFWEADSERTANMASFSS